LSVKNFPLDSLWSPLPCAAGRYRPWLRDRGSLTRRIELRAPNLKVQVLFQGIRRLHRDERFLTCGNAYAVSTLARDVLLVCGNTPVVYAHSVIRPGSRGAARRLLQGMGSRPLGAALFADPRIRRRPLHQKKLGRGHELYRHAAVMLKRPITTLWARRSLFVVGNSPILVTEVFLPEVLEL